MLRHLVYFFKISYDLTHSVTQHQTDILQTIPYQSMLKLVANMITMFIC